MRRAIKCSHSVLESGPKKLQMSEAEVRLHPTTFYVSLIATACAAIRNRLLQHCVYVTLKGVSHHEKDLRLERQISTATLHLTIGALCPEYKNQAADVPATKTRGRI